MLSLNVEKRCKLCLLIKNSLKLISFFHSDKLKLDYVKGAYKTHLGDANIANGYHLNSRAASNEAIYGNDDDDDDEEELEGACALPLKKEGPMLPDKSIEDVLQIETSKIMELFPHFGTGYIRRLLLFYDSSSEVVISKILEGIFFQHFII